MLLSAPVLLLVALCSTGRATIISPDVSSNRRQLRDLPQLNQILFYDSSTESVSTAVHDIGGAAEAATAFRAGQGNSTETLGFSGSTLDEAICSLTSCSILGKASCDVKSVLAAGLHYVYHSSQACNLLGRQHRCCAQTCKADSECPLNHYCQGFNSGQKYCYHCHDCP